ncbi:MAG: ATP-dependent helicase HrpB [Myxococcales bacterium]
MIDKVAGALPSTGAASATTGASFKGALQGTSAAKGAAFKAPSPAAKPGAAQPKVAAAKPNAVEPGTRMEVARPQPKAQLNVQAPSPAKVLNQVQQAQKRLDTLLKMAESGRTFSPAELLAFQAHAYRATQELDLASKVVEKGTSAVKTTLQTQL